MSGSSVWFIYALGSGWGHLNRALALAQAAAKHYRIHLLTNSPYAERLVSIVETKTLTLHLLPRTDSLADAKRSVLSILASVNYDCLIVDTFPRGLIGELVSLICEQQNVCRVLVHRDLASDYIEAKNLEAFVAQHYDGILVPGEIDAPFIDFPQAHLTAPWLSRRAVDLIPDPLPGWRIQSPLVIVCAAGQPQELDLFGQIASDLSAALPSATVRCLAATCPATCSSGLWISHWPGMDLLQFAAVVVGSGGYNLVHECAALRLPLVAFALPRRYDRQEKRIRQHSTLVTSVEEIVSTVQACLEQSCLKQSCLKQSRLEQFCIDQARNCRRAGYASGVDEAIAYIQAWNQTN